MDNEFIRELQAINSSILFMNVSLKKFNTLKLESKVKYLIKPTNFIELKKVLYILKRFNISYYVIGNGSNIIFTSKEKTCLIKLDLKKSKYNNILMASELLMIKANELSNQGYSGFEYISNIPASIGGAIVMNAGAYSHHLSDIIEFVYYLDEHFNIKVMKQNDCDFKYRYSIFKDSDKIVLGCKIRLIEDDKNNLKEIIYECNEKRKITQPIEYPNCGSVFKNTSNNKAWELVDSVNLRGYKLNGAMVSEKHCNFIVNLGNATGEDIINIIKFVKIKVKDTFDINLEEEIVIID